MTPDSWGEKRRGIVSVPGPGAGATRGAGTADGRHPRSTPEAPSRSTWRRTSLVKSASTQCMEEMKMRLSVGSLVVVAGVALALCVGCDKGQKSGGGGSTGSTTAAAAGGNVDAAAFFKMRCSVCHGEHGLGDGPGGAALNPKPRNFTDATWQASVDDDHIKKTITEGGAAVGKSPAMAPNPDLKSKPELLNALVKYVRSLKK